MQQRGAAIARHILAVNQRYRNLHPVTCRRPDALGDVGAGVVTEHRFGLEQTTLAAGHVQFVGGLRRGQRGVDVAQPAAVGLGIDRKPHGVSRFVGLHQEGFAVARQHADAAQAFGAFTQRDKAVEQLEAGEEHFLVVRDPFLPAGTVAHGVLGHGHQPVVGRVPVGADHPATVQMIGVVQEITLARCQHEEIRRVFQRSATQLAGHRALQRDAQVLLGAGARNPQVEGFVGLLVDQLVGAGRSAEAMPFDALAEQGFRIVFDVVQGAVIGAPYQCRRDAFDHIGMHISAGQIPDPQRVLATAHVIFDPGQKTSAGADFVTADLEIALVLRQRIAIEQDFLRRLHAALAACVDRVLAAFLVAAVIPVTLFQERHAGIVRLDPRDDLVIQRAADLGLRRQQRIGVGVLGFQIGDDRGILAAVVAQPVVRVFAAGTVRCHHLVRLGGSHRRCGLGCHRIVHRITLRSAAAGCQYAACQPCQCPLATGRKPHCAAPFESNRCCFR